MRRRSNGRQLSRGRGRRGSFSRNSSRSLDGRRPPPRSDRFGRAQGPVRRVDGSRSCSRSFGRRPRDQRRFRSPSRRSGQSEERRGPRGPPRRAEAWDCSCGWHNFAHREVCQKCRRPPPTPGSEEASGRDDRREDPPPPPPPDSLGSYLPPPPYSGAYAAGGRPYNEYDYARATYAPAPPGGWAGYGDGKRDYADEKPAAYAAVLTHVRRIPSLHGGPPDLELILSNGMCLDHHVSDLLRCIEAWMNREIGPRAMGAVWRLGRLDLSNNGLADESVARVVEQLKYMDVRIRRLDLDANKVSNRTLTSLVDYVWACSEALVEIGLADNQISVPAKMDGDDQLSALLRCIYNHPAYPRKLQALAHGAPPYIAPLVLRLKGNLIDDIADIIGNIQEKVGNGKARFVISAEPYVCGAEEFLSVYLPELLEAGDGTDKILTRGNGDATGNASSEDYYSSAGSSCGEDSEAKERVAEEEEKAAQQLLASAVSSAAEADAVEDDALADAVDPLEGDSDRQPPDSTPPPRKRRRRGAFCEAEDLERYPSPQPPPQESPVRHHAAGDEDDIASEAEGTCANRRVHKRKKRRRMPDEHLEDFSDIVDGTLSKKEQKLLQRDIKEGLSTIPNMPTELETKEMLAELVVCMLLSKTKKVEMIAELDTLLGDQAPSFVRWLSGHLRGTWLRGRRLRAGATPKAPPPARAAAAAADAAAAAKPSAARPKRRAA